MFYFRLKYGTQSREARKRVRYEDTGHRLCRAD